MSTLWDEIKGPLDSGIETPKIDLKRELDLSTRPKAAEFAKDVAAIANTSGGTGYIVIGVLDRGQRKGMTDYVPGFEGDPDLLYRQMLQALSNYVDPPPDIDYQELNHPTTGRKISRKIGVIVIHASYRRPHVIARNSEGIANGQIWVRRGSETFIASREEIIEMTGDEWRRRIEDVKRLQVT